MTDLDSGRLSRRKLLAPGAAMIAAAAASGTASEDPHAFPPLAVMGSLETELNYVNAFSENDFAEDRTRLPCQR
jgi:hypothetical protein